MKTWKKLAAAIALSPLMSPIVPLTAHAADPIYEREKATATAIADAFLTGKAKVYRLAAASQLAAIANKPRADLVAALRALVDVAIAKGSQGLEGAVTSTAAELATRDAAAWRIARAELARLAPRYRIADAGRRPNALIALALPGLPLAQYLPVKLARRILQGQLTTGTVDIETAFEESVCNETALTRIQTELGTAAADALRRLCGDLGGMGTGGALGGDLGLGYLGDASLIGCIQGHNQTRAERIDQLMQDCQDSLLAIGGGNPLADGAFADALLPPHPAQFADVFWDPATKTLRLTMYTAPPDDGGRPVTQIDSSPTRTVVTEFADNGTVDVRETRDHKTGVTTLEASDKYGHERVEIRPDNSYVVIATDTDGNVTRQEYDKDGKAVGTSNGTGEDLGRTPECRELTLSLIGARGDAIMESQGIDPRTSRPTEPAEPTSSDLDCLGFAAGPNLDQSFGCVSDLALCPEGSFRDAGCSCKPAARGVMPADQCGMFMRCADGLPPAFSDGSCTCGDWDETLYVDDGTAPGPRPMPVDNLPW